MLSTITEEIKTFLNNTTIFTSGSSRWYKKLQADIAFDPSTLFSDSKSGLWVIPVYMQYSLEKGNKRGVNVLSVMKMPVISIAISLPFTSYKENDVAKWDEIRQILDMRETIDTRIAVHPWSIPLTQNGINSEAPVEVHLDQRWFLSITEFTFEGLACT